MSPAKPQVNGDNCRRILLRKRSHGRAKVGCRAEAYGAQPLRQKEEKDIVSFF
tara:strand:- start:126 stop:284 length:159 start_codon:yes stop_codon:yes gene_type:complete